MTWKREKLASYVRRYYYVRRMAGHEWTIKRSGNCWKLLRDGELTSCTAWHLATVKQEAERMAASCWEPGR